MSEADQVGIDHPAEDGDARRLVADQRAEAAVLEVVVVAEAGNQEDVAPSRGLRLEAAHDLAVNRVGDVGHHQPERLASPPRQVPGGGVRHVSDLLGDERDERARPLADLRVVAQGA